MPRVFLSYSHEEPEHDQWVMDLGKLLRENGADAYLDKWDLIPGQDTTYFMESQIRRCNGTLFNNSVICGYRRINSRAGNYSLEKWILEF